MKFDIGQYREFRLPEWFDDGEGVLAKTLAEVWNRRYMDIYDRGGEADVEAAFAEVLNAIGLPTDNKITHRRYVYIAYAMALAAKPTVEKYYPENRKFEAVEEAVSLWLKGIEVPPDFADSIFPHINEMGRYQAVNEAYNIFYNCLKTLEPESAYNAVLDILYDGITGDAISGFAAACRDMFNWWLIEVVPAAYCLKLPATIYSGKWQFPPLSQCPPVVGTIDASKVVQQPH